MHRLISAGRIMFALGIAGLGILTLLSRDFIIGRPPSWPSDWSVNPMLAYVSGGLVILCALAILFSIQPRIAAFCLSGLVLLLSVLRHVPVFMEDWVNGYKALALAGGGWIVASTYPNGSRGSRRLLFPGLLLLALFFFISGYAHFKFAGFVSDFIPSYIPARTFWAYACGVFLIAAALGLLFSFSRKWAALLAGTMLTGWFLLLHIPRFLMDTTNASDRMGLCESFTCAALCFIIAGITAKEEG